MKRFIIIPRETFAYILIMVVVIISAMIREINLLIILSGLMLGPAVVELASGPDFSFQNQLQT